MAELQQILLDWSKLGQGVKCLQEGPGGLLVPPVFHYGLDQGRSVQETQASQYQNRPVLARGRVGAPAGQWTGNSARTTAAAGPCPPGTRSACTRTRSRRSLTWCGGCVFAPVSHSSGGSVLHVEGGRGEEAVPLVGEEDALSPALPLSLLPPPD